jgi:uncharacterized Fe-S cluster-containing radical SAM superfamily enzyme
MKKVTTYLLTFFIIGIIGSVGVALAFWPAFVSKEQRVAIQKAIKNNDFEAWKNAIISSLTQENFNKIVKKYNVTIEIRELQNTIRQAIKERNYNAYKEAMEKLIDLHKTLLINEKYFNYAMQCYNETGRMPYLGRIGFGFGRYRVW